MDFNLKDIPNHRLFFAVLIFLSICLIPSSEQVGADCYYPCRDDSYCDCGRAFYAGWTSCAHSSCIIGTDLYCGSYPSYVVSCVNSCSDTNRKCKGDACPNYSGWDGESCIVTRDCWNGISCYGQDCTGKWDASNKWCVGCFGGLKTKRLGSSSGIDVACGSCNGYDIPNTCDTACGNTDAACDDHPEGYVCGYGPWEYRNDGCQRRREKKKCVNKPEGCKCELSGEYTDWENTNEGGWCGSTWEACADSSTCDVRTYSHKCSSGICTGTYEYSTGCSTCTACDGNACGDWISFCYDASNCDTRQHKRYCQGESCSGEWHGTIRDSGSGACVDEVCGEKCNPDCPEKCCTRTCSSVEGDCQDCTPPPCDCSCTDWTYHGCGYSTCPWYKKGKTRTCTPSGCDIEFKCYCAESCCTSWTDQGCGQGGCASTEMYQTRDCGTCPYSETRCNPDPSCGGPPPGAENCCNDTDDDDDGRENGYDTDCQNDVNLSSGSNSVCWWTEWNNYSNNRDYYSGWFICPSGYTVSSINIAQYTEANYDYFYMYDENNTQRYKDSGKDGTKTIDFSPYNSQKVRFRFTSDGSVTEDGVKVNTITCSAPACDLNRTGDYRIDFPCILEGEHHLSNGNLTITTGGYLQMNPNSSLTFTEGYKIALEGSGYILTGENTKIQKTELPSERIVFVTSATYNANLGGLSGADSKCQELANAAGLSGNFKAWLSVAGINAKDRICVGTDLPFKKVNGVKVADNCADLLDGTLDSPINIDEWGNTVPSDSEVWTGTDQSGYDTGCCGCHYPRCNNFNFGNQDCNASCDDRSQRPDSWASVGCAGDTNKCWTESKANTGCSCYTSSYYDSSCGWVYSTIGRECHRMYRLYCFETPKETAQQLTINVKLVYSRKDDKYGRYHTVVFDCQNKRDTNAYVTSGCVSTDCDSGERCGLGTETGTKYHDFTFTGFTTDPHYICYFPSSPSGYTWNASIYTYENGAWVLKASGSNVTGRNWLCAYPVYGHP